MFSLRSSLLLSAALLLLPFSTSHAEETAKDSAKAPLRVLHIGNSFSGNATRFLPQLAEAGGKQLDIYGAIIGGSSFAVHAKHLREAKEGKGAGKPYNTKPNLGEPLKDQKKVSLPEVLTAKEWDIVTIQQVSRESFKPETFEPHATEVITEVRNTLPKATLYIHQTWAYRPDHPLFTKQPDLNPEKMQKLANLAYEQLARQHNITHFLPSGLAVEMANRSEEWKYQKDPNFDYANPPEGELPAERSVYLGPRLSKNKDGKQHLTFDAFHLGPAGCYLAACVWYEILFDDSVLEVDFTPNTLTSEEAASLRKIAHETVAAYRQHGLSGVPAAK